MKEWFKGLKVCEEFIKIQGVDQAEIYLDRDLHASGGCYVSGWWDCISHYRKLEGEGL